jgi:hypothetical protein
MLSRAGYSLQRHCESCGPHCWGPKHSDLTRFTMINGSCSRLSFIPLSVGHSLRAIPAPGALRSDLLLRTLTGLDSFPETSSGPLPKQFSLRLGSGPLALWVPRQIRAIKGKLNVQESH